MKEDKIKTSWEEGKNSNFLTTNSKAGRLAELGGEAQEA